MTACFSLCGRVQTMRGRPPTIFAPGGGVMAPMNPASVIVCEDFLPFRQYVVSALGNWDYVRVVCEVCDGQDAVQKANELKPDLILLDVGLPTLNGIAAAYQIRKLVPYSKTIFVTQESSAE